MRKRIDVTGQRFGNLVALHRVEKTTDKEKKNKGALWEFKCDCGNTKRIIVSNVVHGNTKGCGCLMGRKPVLKLEGKKQGIATFISRVRGGWNCICDCGKDFFVGTRQIRSIRSCGCLRNFPDGIPSRNRLFQQMKQGAKKRGFSWGITLSQFSFITKQDCFYCGTSPATKTITRDDIVGYMYNGIDRVDNTIGYIEGNVVPCCRICNVAKNVYSVEDFKNWVIRVCQHWANPVSLSQ